MQPAKNRRRDEATLRRESTPARGRLRQQVPDLQRALQGRFRRRHAFLIEEGLAKIDFLDETIDRVTAEIDRRLGPVA